ncbi:MAG TPA: hypothetical protein VGC54_06505 [Planctomycetota bacterium]
MSRPSRHFFTAAAAALLCLPACTTVMESGFQEDLQSLKPGVRQLPASYDGTAFRGGGEVQVYPTGTIVGVRGEADFGGGEMVSVRAGYNFADREDNGNHDAERGGGPGWGFGYRHYADADGSGWLYGGRLDLWLLDIDWRDRIGKSNRQRRGTTEATVLMPTVEGGYAFSFSNGWRLDFALGVGAEINIDENGESVGDGAILLGGFAFVKDF